MVLDKTLPRVTRRRLLIIMTRKREKKGRFFFVRFCLQPRMCGALDSGVTLLFDLSDLSHGLLEDGTFVGLDVEAVDVGEVGRDELRQLLDVLALLFPPTLVTPAGAPEGLDMLP